MSVRHKMPMHKLLPIVFLVEIIFRTSIQDKFDREVTHLVDRVIGDHFKQFRCVTYVLGEGTEMEFERQQQQLPSIVIRLPADGEVLKESFEQGCGGYVVRVRNKSETVGLLIEAKQRTSGFRYNNQKYLFLPVDEEDDDLDLIRKPELFFLPNLVLVVPKMDALSAVTHTVFDHHKRELLGITHEVLDVWRPGRGFDRGTDLFPDKVSDVKGKKFVFAFVHYSPFSLAIKEGNSTVYDGFETRIAAEFVESVNGTWEGQDHNGNWGDIYPNGTADGIVGSVRSNNADFGYSAFYQWYCDDCDCTYPFYQSAVTCLVPRPPLVPGWLTIVLPFAPDTWVATIVAYIVSSTCLFGVILAMQYQRGSKIKDEIRSVASDSLFTNFRMQFDQIPDIPKSKIPLATYVKISAYYYFFLAIFWKGGISSILTVPRFERPINTVQDLIDNWPRVKWGSDTNAWLNSIKASSEPNLVQIVQKFVVHDNQTLNEKVKTGDFGFFMEELPHGHYGLGDFITEESMKYLRLMQNNIYTAFGVLILPRGSPYSEKFDRTVLRLFDTGIVHKMEVQVSLDRINNRLQNMIKKSDVKESTTVILAIRHLQGPIYIYFAGMGLAVFVFFLELCLLGQNRTTKDLERTVPL